MAVVRDVVIRFRGEDEQLKKASTTLDEVNRKVKQVGDSTVKSSQQIKGATASATQSFQGLNNTINSLGQTILASFSVAAVVQFGKAALDSFRQAEESARKLSFAVRQIANGSSGDIDILLKQSKQLQEQGIFSDEQIQHAQTALLTIGLTVEEVEKLVPAIADAAALNGEFDGTLQKVIMGINGSNRGLNQMGVFLGDVKDKGERVNKITQIMTENFGGGLADALKTSAGSAANLNNRWDEMMEKMGGLIADGIDIMKASIADLVDGMDEFGESAEGTVDSINQLIKSFIEYSTLGIVTFEGSTSNAIKAQKEFKRALEDTISAMGGTTQDRLLALRVEWGKLEDAWFAGELTMEDYKIKYSTIVNELVQITKDAQKKVGPVTPDCDDDCVKKKKEDAEKLHKEMMELRKSQLRQLQELEASMFEEGAEREKALRKVKFDQELEDVVGHTELSNELRKALTEKYFQDIRDIEQKDREEKAKIREKEAEEEEKRRKDADDKKKKEDDDALKKLEDLEKAKQALILETEQIYYDIESAKIDAFSEGFSVLAGLAKDNAGLQNKLLAFEKLAAIIELIVNLQREKAYNTAAAAASSLINPALTTFYDARAVAKNQFATVRTGISIATIAAQVIPQLALAEGVIDLKRGKNPIGRDTIPAMLDEGESVMTKDETKKHKGLFQAIRNEEFEKYINERFVLPKLNMALGYKWLGAEAGRPVNATFDERKLAKAMPKRISVGNIGELAKAMAKEHRKDKMFKRRGVN